MAHRPFASAPYIVGRSAPAPAEAHIPAEESLCPVVSHDWVNAEYKHLDRRGVAQGADGQARPVLQSALPVARRRRAVAAAAAERLSHRPAPSGRIEFLYKCVGRGTYGLATLKRGDDLNMVGPLGVGFTVDPGWKHIVVLGRGVGLATLAPISQLAGEHGIGVTAILSARSPEFVMAGDLFAQGRRRHQRARHRRHAARSRTSRRSSQRLIAQRKADAFFTCGSNRLFQLMKRARPRPHGIPGQVAMEQVMACGLGPCYVCVRTFEVDGKKELRRVCIEGPVFDLQEAVGW